MTTRRLDFDVVRVIDSPGLWAEHIRECVASLPRVRVASGLGSVDWNRFNLNDYLFTHCTIVASVVSDPRDDHTIMPGSIDYINANGNAWLNDVLGSPTMLYRTFIGGENYVEHVQVPTLSKGKILDAVLRKVKNGDGDNMYLCDLLIATDRNHRELVARIEKKQLTTLSMGCIANVTQCSRCGKVVRHDNDECVHLRHELGSQYTTKYGYKSVVAELCGLPNDPESCRFIEASWVESPAYKGAVINHFVNVPHDDTCKVIKLADRIVDLNNVTHDDINVLSHVRVANHSSMLGFRLMVERLKEAEKKRRTLRNAAMLELLSEAEGQRC